MTWHARDHISTMDIHAIKSMQARSSAGGWFVFLLIAAGSTLWPSCDQEKDRTSSFPQVPDGYTVEIVAGPDLVDYPMFSTLDESGRLFVFESTGNVYKETEDAIRDPKFRIRLLEDLDGDGVYDKSTIYADKIGFPQGGVFYRGSLYASSAPDLLKLTDTDGDGVADQREVLLSGWTLNVNANSLVGPFMAPDGWLYMTSAIMGFDVKTQEGVQLKGETSRIWRLRPDGSGLEWIAAGGMNNPVELAFTPAGEAIGTETYFTDPKAGERDALVYWTEGGVYPKPNSNIDRDSLVRTGDLMPVVSKYSRVAPSGIASYRGSALGEDFRNNLFSAQFNTHRVIRHKLLRDGASFRTEDEVFFSFDNNEDFHPTDVLEDADGSLLIVETGGWFIKGCPLSQVSKPELKGAIYRVRKKQAPQVEDPYGNNIRWDTLSVIQAGEYLKDEGRPFVSDRAQEWLINRGTDAVPVLKELLQHEASAVVRARIVFALYRIGTTEAMALIRTRALDDPDIDVRVAAARTLGMAGSEEARPRLKQLLLTDAPAVKRQVATALGQIGSKPDAEELLHAAAGEEDRFVRHALIYALVGINDPRPVRAGLAHPAPGVQEAALIALDQMPDSDIRPSDITPFLQGENPELRNTALWVASHHPRWSAEMIGFLKRRLGTGALDEEEKKLLGKLLVSFCEQSDMQQFMAAYLRNTETPHQLFILNAMAESRMKEFPRSWIEGIGRQLESADDPLLKAKAIELAGLRGLTMLAPVLRGVAADKQLSPELRLDAIAVLLKQDTVLRSSDFDFLYAQLDASAAVPLRQKAAHVLSLASVSEDQLRRLAADYLPHADAFILPRLMSVFTGAHSGEVGRSFASALSQSSTLDGYTEEEVEKVFEKYPAEIRPAVDELLVKLRQVRSERLERLQDMESRIHTGVLENGRKLFFGKATCAVCHTIGPEGGHFGPDLTSIQRDRSAHDLLEAIVYPGASFVREFETYKITMRTDEYTGMLRERTPDAVLLAVAPENLVRIPVGDIMAMEIQPTSMMPQGLDKLLTAQEMADLMAFLLGQDQDPETDQQLLR